MSFQESKFLTSLLTTAAVAAVYGWKVGEMYASGAFTGASSHALVGQAALVFIGAVVGVGILGQIINGIVAGALGCEIELREDERDRHIELRAVNVAFSIFGAGFLGAMVALAFGRSTFEVIHLILASLVGCGIVADCVRLWLYRWGH